MVSDVFRTPFRLEWWSHDTLALFCFISSWVSYGGDSQVAMDSHLGKRLLRRARTFPCGSIRAIQTLPMIFLVYLQSDAPQVLWIFVGLVVFRDRIWCYGSICNTKVSHWPGFIYWHECLGRHGQHDLQDQRSSFLVLIDDELVRLHRNCVHHCCTSLLRY